MRCCFYDPLFSRFSRTPTCDRHRHRPMASTADAQHRALKTPAKNLFRDNLGKPVLVLLLQPFNGLFSRTTWVSRYQKGKTNLDFTAARDSEWQWHQLGRMQVCTSLQTDNHASTPPLCFLQAGCPSCCPTNSVKALKAQASTGSRKLKPFWILIRDDGVWDSSNVAETTRK